MKEDHERASAHTGTKKEAVDRAREIVENVGGAEVRQANKDGRFGDSDTTKPGRESREKGHQVEALRTPPPAPSSSAYFRRVREVLQDRNIRLARIARRVVASSCSSNGGGLRVSGFPAACLHRSVGFPRERGAAEPTY